MKHEEFTYLMETMRLRNRKPTIEENEMSADNMIYIKEVKGRWYVWMGFASDSKKPKPSKKHDASFETIEEARAYAQGWYRAEWVVEYGIIELE